MKFGPDGIAPRVAVKSHMDGDPKPRNDEIAEWDQIRRDFKLDEFLCVILLPWGTVTRRYEGLQPVVGHQFPSFEAFGWAIRERDGLVVCEPEQIKIGLEVT